MMCAVNLPACLFWGDLWFLGWGAVALVALAAFYVAVRIFGWERVRPFVLPVLGALAAIAAAAKIRKSGRDERIRDEQVAQEKAEDIVDEKRTDIANDSDAELDQKADRWTR